MKLQLITGAWFALYMGYSYFKVNKIDSFLDSFYDEGIISELDYTILKDKYNGRMRFYAGLPNKVRYGEFYKRTDFKKFSITVRLLTWFFILSGIMMFFLLSTQS